MRNFQTLFMAGSWLGAITAASKCPAENSNYMYCWLCC